MVNFLWGDKLSSESNVRGARKHPTLEFHDTEVNKLTTLFLLFVETKDLLTQQHH